ncbi:hypothetical protein VPH35_119556 [Triticum aestivum]
MPYSPTSSPVMPSASHTAWDASTTLLRHGGWKACSRSHPFRESHSSTTLASTDLPLARIRMRSPQREPPAYHPVDSATTRSELRWKTSSHADGSPPSPPSSKSLSVMMALVAPATTGGEHRYVGYAFPASQQSSHEWPLPGRSVPLRLHSCAPTVVASSSASTTRQLMVIFL